MDLEETTYKLCKRGHVRSPENVGKRGECKICKTIWRQENPEKAILAVRRWEQNNPEKARLIKAKRNRTYREKHLERIRKYRQDHPEDSATRKERYHRNITVNRARNKRIQSELTDAVIAKVLGLPVREATPELIEIKRMTIQLGRMLKNGTNNIRKSGDKVKSGV